MTKPDDRERVLERMRIEIEEAKRRGWCPKPDPAPRKKTSLEYIIKTREQGDRLLADLRRLSEED